MSEHVYLRIESKAAEQQLLLHLMSLACALMFFHGFFLGGMQLVITDIAAEFGVGTAGMGMLVSAQYAASVIAPIAAGVLTDRLGKKLPLIAASAAFGIGCALIGIAPALRIYIIGACLTGVGYSVCESLSSAALSDLGDKQGPGGTAHRSLLIGAQYLPHIKIVRC